MHSNGGSSQHGDYRGANNGTSGSYSSYRPQNESPDVARFNSGYSGSSRGRYEDLAQGREQHSDYRGQRSNDSYDDGYSRAPRRDAQPRSEYASYSDSPDRRFPQSSHSGSQYGTSRSDYGPSPRSYDRKSDGYSHERSTTNDGYEDRSFGRRSPPRSYRSNDDIRDRGSGFYSQTGERDFNSRDQSQPYRGYGSHHMETGKYEVPPDTFGATMPSASTGSTSIRDPSNFRSSASHFPVPPDTMSHPGSYRHHSYDELQKPQSMSTSSGSFPPAPAKSQSQGFDSQLLSMSRAPTQPLDGYGSSAHSTSSMQLSASSSSHGLQTSSSTGPVTSENLLTSLASSLRSHLGISGLNGDDSARFKQAIESNLASLQALQTLEAEVTKVHANAGTNFTAAVEAEIAAEKLFFEYFTVDHQLRIVEGDLDECKRVIGSLSSLEGSYPDSQFECRPTQTFDELLASDLPISDVATFPHEPMQQSTNVM